MFEISETIETIENSSSILADLNQFSANNYPKVKEYFDNNKLKEHCLFFALIENMYQSINGIGVIRELAFASFDVKKVQDFILKLPMQTDVSYGIRGYLKKNK